MPSAFLRRLFRVALMTIGALTLSVAIAGCEDDAEDDLQDARESVEDAAKKFQDDVANKLEEMADEAEDATDEMNN